jgi:predicted esterase
MAWRLDGAGDASAPLVLCLHGYGMDEDLFAALVQKLFTLPMLFLVPRAPQHVHGGLEAANGGSWYAYDGNQERFRRELERVEAELLDLLRDVEAEATLRPRSRWVVGFSQGGYCGSWLALRNPSTFSGLIVSGARVKTELLDAEMAAAAAQRFGVLLCHGEKDRSVTPEAAHRSRDALAAAGVDVQLKTFDVGHSLGRGQVDAMAEWLTRATGADGAR